MTKTRLTVSLLVSTLSLHAFAANIVIKNNDGVDEGFNDPNPPANANQKGATNSGNTLGELRLEVFTEAARVWAGIVNSNVTITIGATFDVLFFF
jgi:type 1 fimbria pilin